jgi:hypothetical protein
MTTEPAPWHAGEAIRLNWPSPAELRAMSNDDLRQRVRKLGWPDLSRLDPYTIDECCHRGWIVRAPQHPRSASFTSYSDLQGE